MINIKNISVTTHRYIYIYILPKFTKIDQQMEH